MAKMAGRLFVVVVLVAYSLVTVSCNGFDQVVKLYSSAESERCGPKLAIETPECEVVKKKDGYELRKYPKDQVWVETLVPNSSYAVATSVGFYRLFYYISGKNAKGEIIEMTAPVLIHPHRKCAGYKISFFAPSRFKSHEDLPKPLDQNIDFVETKEETYAVLGPFGGFPTDSDYQKKLDSLKDALDKDDIEYEKEKVYYAGYSSPFEFVNRKQEVHILITDE